VRRNQRTAAFHGSWWRGEHTNFIPSKPDLREADAIENFILSGWLPPAPFITKQTVVTAFGSCFAHHVTNHLHERGYNVLGRHLDLNSHIIRFGEGIVNTFAIRQQLEWAIRGKVFPDFLWFGPNKEIAHVDPQIQAETLDIIRRTEVLILTLGLSEVWYHKETGEVLWRAVPAELFDDKVFGFRVSTVEENKANLETIWETVRSVRKDAPLIFTLSPVPLMATFRPISCLTASSVSKAILRAALDEFLRNHAEDPNLYYFPSYEIVKEFVVDPFKEDNRHPKPEVISMIMETFEKHYCVP
jgi:hypothetical protein